MAKIKNKLKGEYTKVLGNEEYKKLNGSTAMR